MTTMQFPVDDITAQAREATFPRVALTFFLGIFWVLGWAAARAWLGVAWVTLASLWAAGYVAGTAAIAVRRGWRDAVGIPEPSPSPQRQPAASR